MDAIVISDPMRVPTTAQRREDGKIIVRVPGKDVNTLIFSPAEIERLYRFSQGLGTMQRHIAQ